MTILVQKRYLIFFIHSNLEASPQWRLLSPLPTPRMWNFLFSPFGSKTVRQEADNNPCWRPLLTGGPQFQRMRQRKRVYRNLGLGRKDEWGWEGVERVRVGLPQHVRCESWDIGGACSQGASGKSPNYPGTLPFSSGHLSSEQRENCAFFSCMHTCVCVCVYVCPRTWVRKRGHLFFPPIKHMIFFNL